MGVGREAGGPVFKSPRILKISAKNGCFFSFEWEKTNFLLLPPPLEKILPWSGVIIRLKR